VRAGEPGTGSTYDRSNSSRRVIAPPGRSFGESRLTNGKRPVKRIVWTCEEAAEANTQQARRQREVMFMGGTLGWKTHRIGDRGKRATTGLDDRP
jgi:hypothetical protein